MTPFEESLKIGLDAAADTIDGSDDWDTVLQDAGQSQRPRRDQRSRGALLLAAAALVAGMYGLTKAANDTPATTDTATTIDPVDAPSVVALLSPVPRFDTSSLGTEVQAFGRSGIEEVDEYFELSRLSELDVENAPAGERYGLQILGERGGTWSSTYKIRRFDDSSVTCYALQDQGVSSDYCADLRDDELEPIVGSRIVANGGTRLGWTTVASAASVVAWEQDGERFWQRPVGRVVAFTPPEGQDYLPALDLYDIDGNLMMTVPGPPTLAENVGILPGEIVLQETPLIVLAPMGPEPAFDTTALGEETLGFDRPSPGDDVSDFELFPPDFGPSGDRTMIKLSIVDSTPGELGRWSNGSAIYELAESSELGECLAWSGANTGFVCGGHDTPMARPFGLLSPVNEREPGGSRIVGVGPDVAAVAWELSGEPYWQRPIDGLVAIDLGASTANDLTSFRLLRADGNEILSAGPLLTELRATMTYSPIILPGETVLAEAPLVVLAALGPEPEFDTSALGEQVEVLDRSDADPTKLINAASGDEPEPLITYKVTALGSVDGVWSWEHEYKAVPDQQLSPSSGTIYSRHYRSQFGADTYQADLPGQRRADGVSRIGQSGSAHIWVEVPSGTAAVGLVSDGRSEWQRPSGGLAVFDKQLSFGEEALITAYGTSGSELARLTVSERDDQTGSIGPTMEPQLGPFTLQQELGRVWARDRTGALVEIKADGRPIVFFFGADWCETCEAQLADIVSEASNLDDYRFVYVGEAKDYEALVSPESWPFEAISPTGSGALANLDSGPYFPVPTILITNADRTIAAWASGDGVVETLRNYAG